MQAAPPGAPRTMSKTATILRYAGSALLAGAFVAVAGGWIVHRFVGRQPSRTVGLTVIRGIQLITHVPGTQSLGAAAQSGPMLPGFVQLGFKVGADGRAHDIHVIRAVPPGQYEQAAREIVAARRFKPAAGKAGGIERTEVVHFQVPASVLSAQSQGGGSGGS